jgi:exopolyphosphatase/guanosine-5'-triphosphate,3'-diphosphate pyrophosphatase
MARTRGRKSGGTNEVNQVELPTDQVAELAAQLASLDLKERLALPGMPSRRAPMLPIGATILETFAREMEVDHFVVSEWGLREGALLDAISDYERDRGTPPSRDTDDA